MGAGRAATVFKRREEAKAVEAAEAAAAARDSAVKGFTTAGLTGTFSPEQNQFVLGRTPELTGLLNTIQARQSALGERLGGLIPQVAPITGRVTQSGLEQVEARRRQAIGNLRENLARRRISGSSFGQQAIARTEAQFAQEAADVAAKGAITELQLTQDLIQKQAMAELSGLNTMLAQFNLEAGLGAQLSGSATQAIQSAIQFQQQLAAQQAIAEEQASAAESAGLGQLAGTLGAAAIIASDRRVKHDIELIGYLKHNWYTFKYLNSDEEFFGVMAQEVPHAVIEGEILKVDYGRL